MGKSELEIYIGKFRLLYYTKNNIMFIKHLRQIGI